MKWISVKDRLPRADEIDENGKVLIWRHTNDAQKALSKSIYDANMLKYCFEETYWMPLPEPPK